MKAKTTPPTPLNDATPLAAAASLFAQDGPFAMDRNPALLLSAADEVVAANGAAVPLINLLGAPPPEFATALQAARTGTSARIAALELPGADGKILSFDLSL